MNRNISVARPIMYPACCISCGTVENSGRWFVDLGFNIDERFDAMPDGVVYLCSECVRNFIKDLMRIVEEQDGGLARVRLEGNRTDPIFDEYREVLNGIELAVNERNSDVSETEQHTDSFAAGRFGGISN
jgi:hypothetical protein